jgi:hypothetical protein
LAEEDNRREQEGLEVVVVLRINMQEAAGDRL